ncbi:MAG: AmmeMemoRadiSam system radical SAM enzyme [Deltaproteobacteria bacterium]|nr:AmmeMemoRadiSam system radical SAM enzyme [Deltaproteobacteria bacterium]
MTTDHSPTHPALYWQDLPHGRIECQVCPNACRLKEDARGRCFGRARREGRMILTTYGHTRGLCIDPIEKKPLYHFMPGSPILSFGTAGCNLACKFCQNWDLSTAIGLDAATERAQPEQLAQTAQKYNCNSVAFTYNEPITFIEYAIDTAKFCLERNIRTVAVTNGYVWKEARRDFFKYISAANIDLKSFSENFYREFCAGHLEPVLDTLKYLKQETEVWLELTTLLIPGLNDSLEEIEAMSEWILKNLSPEVPLHFSAFHPAHQMPNTPPTPAETVKAARRVALKTGLKHVYTGNILDPEGASTYCGACGKLVIERQGYKLSKYSLDPEGRCLFCGSKCPGIFDRPCGTWGDSSN